MNRYKQSIIIALIVVSAAILFAFSETVGDRPVIPGAMPTRTGPITLSIEGMGAPRSLNTSETTLLQTLTTVDAEDPRMQLSTKTYDGIGTLIESMYGLKNGTDNKYWQYKVNNVMPQIGADAYIPKAGDSIEWYFAQSTM